MCVISSQHQFAQLIKHNDAAIITTTTSSVDCVYPASVSEYLRPSPRLRISTVAGGGCLHECRH